MKEMFLHQALKLGEIFAEGIYQEVVPIYQTEQGILLHLKVRS